MPPKPTATEASLAERQQIIELSAEGQSAKAIAARLGCAERTVYRWRKRYREVGVAGLQPRSRRPQRPHPQTTPEHNGAVVARIAAIRAAHPGWGARLIRRLIRRQLLSEEVAPVPNEGTIQQWLKRLGFGLVRPPVGKRLGWRPPEPPPSNARWQLDHKQKGGWCI
jgi:transposase